MSANQDSGARVLRIIGLVALAGVVLCGLAGSCLLGLTLIAPLFAQGG
ncbi:MAG: hypothetical protein IT318_22000 [Anaerolineales bacterium]|nr:hypothetical protein [Anaerolineales bacterium]